MLVDGTDVTEDAAVETDFLVSDTAPDSPPGDIAGDEGAGDTQPLFDPFPEDKAARLEVLLEEYVLYSGEPGIALSVLQGNALWSGAAGLADVGDSKEMEPGMGFRVGSNTKPYVASVILLLAREDKLTLDDPLSLYFPEYPVWGQITIRQLLSMRSGIPDYFASPALWLDTIADPGQPMTPEKLLSYVADKPLLYVPGKQSNYSNSNYLLAGLIIEQVAGHPVQDEIRERIVEPLGLMHTYLDVGEASDEGLAHGYVDIEYAASVLGMEPAMTALIPPEYLVEHLGDSILDCTHIFHPSVVWAAGGLISTPQDGVRFMKALLNGEILDDDSLAEMMDFGSIEAGIEDAYGLGLGRMATPLGTAYGHGGLMLGYGANVLYLPGWDLAVSQMNGFLPSQSAIALVEAFEVVLAGKAEASQACVPPAEFLEHGVAEPYLEFRFRGALNAEDSPSPAQALGWFKGVLADDVVSLSGVYTAGKISFPGGQQRLVLESYGAAAGKEVRARYAVVSPDSSLFADVVEQPHLIGKPAAPFDYDLFASVADVYLDPATGEADMICVTGVADSTRPWELYVCDAESFAVEAKTTVKLWGIIPLDTDPEAVEAYLAPLNMPVCNCRQPGGDWKPCDQAM